MEKTITQYLDHEYTNYAMYVIESRALSSVIDGLKPTQRKIIYVANKTWRTGTEKPMKIFQLGGRIANEAFYHHGDNGLYGGIINLAQKFKNNLPFLQEIGQFGSLRSPDAGAPRYISTKLHPNFKLIYKDFELLESRWEEGIKIEPTFFLPIIPTILINGSKGIAVGYAANILMRDPKRVIKQCLNYLDNKKIQNIKPKLNMFNGTFIQDKQNPKKWYALGIFERINTSTIKITELPPSLTFEKWEALLEKLISNKTIVSYDDNSKEKLEYVIKFNRVFLSELKDVDIIKLFKLSESYTEDFNTLDEYGKLKIFQNTTEIINYFMNFRLTFYHKRKLFMIQKTETEIFILNNKAKFMKAIIQDVLKINKRKREIIEKDLNKLKIEKSDDSYNYLLNMNIASLTLERYNDLIATLRNCKTQLQEIRKLKPDLMFKDDLITLQQKL